MTDLREEVRARYADAAQQVGADAGCCGVADAEGNCAISPEEADRFGLSQYGSEVDTLPGTAGAASMGCGNPTAVADLHPGETVLDLGSGGGIDVFLAARRVGPEGKAIGIDMTDEMLDLARRNQAQAGVDNVEFRKGYIEDMPVADGTIDVVVSNCVINLSADKAKVFSEMYRVLRPGGRLGVTDIVADDDLDAAGRAARGSHVGCIAGALSFTEYRSGLETAGFGDVSVTATRGVADRMHSAIIKATKPPAAGGGTARPWRAPA